jgi:hypothetical protein
MSSLKVRINSNTTSRWYKKERWVILNLNFNNRIYRDSSTMTSQEHTVSLLKLIKEFRNLTKEIWSSLHINEEECNIRDKLKRIIQRIDLPTNRS